MKELKEVFKNYYNPLHILSYNRPLMFSTGARNIGKSAGWGCIAIYNFIKHGSQFIYTRRTKDETELTAANYFDNSASILKHHGFEIDNVEYKHKKYFINGKLAGYALPLNQQAKYKSANFAKVELIIYDEFMITPGSSGYLGGKGNLNREVDAMSSLYQTVDRDVGSAFRNKTKIVFLGNAGTFYNPFFINYGIDKYLRPDTKILAPKNEIYVCEFTSGVESTKDFKNSVAYNMSTKKTKEYAYENKFADISASEFIVDKDPTGSRAPLCNISYDGEKYGVYSYITKGFIYISKRLCDGRQMLALTMDDHRPNYLLISKWRSHPITTDIKMMYDLGCIKFCNHKAKMAIDFYLNYVTI